MLGKEILIFTEGFLAGFGTMGIITVCILLKLKRELEDILKLIRRDNGTMKDEIYKGGDINGNKR